MSRLPFARQMLLLQLLVVVAVIVLATATYGVLATVAHRESAESTALAIARTVAENADLQTAVTEETEDPAAADGGALALGPVQLIAESARSRTGALFVVVTDDRGMRLAHPNAALLGQRVSTDPAVALGGHEETSWERGTLGDSARAKVPVRGQDGTVVGEVSVGFGAAGVFDSAAVDLGAIAIVAASAVLLGALASAVLARRLNRQTLGLQPSELAGMVHDQAAVLGGIGEGVLGIAADGRVSVCNARAATLLNLEEPIGRPVGALALPDQLLAALTADTRTAQTLRLVVEDRLLFADVSRVDRDGIDLGSVVVVRDETDVEAMAQRLSAVSAMTSALRVQRHEFANRLHVVSGLLETGRTAEARSYVAGVLERGPVSYPVHGSELLTEPYLQAFVGAKAMEAGERGVAVRIGPGTLVLGTLVRPEEVTTVLGNLLDNAVRAAAESDREPRFVEVEALADGGDLHILVADSGDGVVEPIFPTSRSSVALDVGLDDAERVHGRGIGLRLSRDLARRDGGDLWLASSGGDGAGAVFCARLVGVLSAGSTTSAHSPASRDNG